MVAAHAFGLGTCSGDKRTAIFSTAVDVSIFGLRHASKNAARSAVTRPGLVGVVRAGLAGFVFTVAAGRLDLAVAVVAVVFAGGVALFCLACVFLSGGHHIRGRGTAIIIGIAGLAGLVGLVGLVYLVSFVLSPFGCLVVAVGYLVVAGGVAGITFGEV